MNFEEQIIKAAQESIGEAIKKKLEGYGSPLEKLVDVVVQNNAAAIHDLMDSAIKDALKGDFAKALQEACTHKLAKVIIAKTEGEIEKRANELRGSPEFRAKLTLAIGQAIDSCGK